MKVTVGAWYDERMSVFDIQIYDSELSESEILRSIIRDRQEFGYKLISAKDNYVAFSDGTRFMISTHHVNHYLEIYDRKIELEE